MCAANFCRAAGSPAAAGRGPAGQAGKSRRGAATRSPPPGPRSRNMFYARHSSQPPTGPRSRPPGDVAGHSVMTDGSPRPELAARGVCGRAGRPAAAPPENLLQPGRSPLGRFYAYGEARGSGRGRPPGPGYRPAEKRPARRPHRCPDPRADLPGQADNTDRHPLADRAAGPVFFLDPRGLALARLVG